MKAVKLVAGATLILCAPHPSAAQEIRAAGTTERDWGAAALQLVISPDVSKALDRLADHQTDELVRCLEGSREGDHITIDRAEEPQIITANHGAVRYQPCPRETLALWHTHPPISGLRPEHLCYLSTVDIATALNRRAPPVQIVQVKSKVRCWWSVADVRAAQNAPVLLALPSQRSGKPIDQNAVDCNGPGRVLPICLAGQPSRTVAAANSLSGGAVSASAIRPLPH